MKTAFILGGAQGGLDELKAAKPGKDDAVIAVNEIGTVYDGKLAAWVSVHGDMLVGWLQKRKAAGFPDPALVITGKSSGDYEAVRAALRGAKYLEARFPKQQGQGSSGQFATKVALCDLGFDRVILCGLPYDENAGHFNREAPWREASAYHQSWQEVAPQYKGRIFSMSGFTQELFGAPPDQAQQGKQDTGAKSGSGDGSQSQSAKGASDKTGTA